MELGFLLFRIQESVMEMEWSGKKVPEIVIPFSIYGSFRNNILENVRKDITEAIEMFQNTLRKP